MPSGSQSRADGLAKMFAEYVRIEMNARGWSYDDLASRMSMSRSYLYDRATQNKVFTVRDFEEFARVVELEPQELLARVQAPFARGYEGRLVPTYRGVVDADGIEIYRAIDADPLAQEANNVIEGRFGVGASDDDGQQLGEVAGEQRAEHEEDQDDYDS